MLTEGAADDQDARSEAVIALVQTELFESIVSLQEANEEDTKPEERIALLSKAAKNIATLARASVNQKRFRLDEQARIERAARGAAGRAGGEAGRAARRRWHQRADGGPHPPHSVG